MSNDRKPVASLVSLFARQLPDRDILRAMAEDVDANTREIILVRHEQHRLGTAYEGMAKSYDEMAAHLMKTQAEARQTSSHDLDQDAKIRQLAERVEVVETGWHRVGSRFVAFWDDKRTKAVARAGASLVVLYAGGKETGLWTVLAQVLKESGVLP